MNWDDYFMSICDVVAKKSKDPTTKVGCVIASKDHRILSVGFNGFPSGVKDLESRYNDRKTKYKFIVHAEANAISTAARHGISLQGSTLYVPWHPCNECAKLIIQAGISEVVIGSMSDDIRSRWETSCNYAKKMFHEAGVVVRKYE